MSDRSAESIDVFVGARLRAARLEMGLSQERLAELLGITFQQVQKYEKGVNRMAAGRVFVAAEALGKSVASFFPDQTASADGILTPASRDSIRMIRLYETAPAKVQRRIVALVETIAEPEAVR